MDMNLSKLWETVGHRGAWCATVYGVAKSDMSWWLKNINKILQIHAGIYIKAVLLCIAYSFAIILINPWDRIILTFLSSLPYIKILFISVNLHVLFLLFKEFPPHKMPNLFSLILQISGKSFQDTHKLCLYKVPQGFPIITLILIRTLNMMLPT